LTFIEQFYYEVIHRPGAKHGNVDGLSRRPVRADERDESQVCRCLNKEESDIKLSIFESKDNDVCELGPKPETELKKMK